jgi:uncharacterized protein (TIGR02588 family)
MSDQGKSKSGEEDRGNGKEETKERSAAEWITLVVSVIVVVGLLGMVLFDYFSRGSTPPIIDVRYVMEGIRQESEAFYLPVEVENTGAETAEAVEVEVTFKGEDDAEETVGFTVDFLSGEEVHHQTVVFKMDPREGELAHTVSFSTP